MDKFGWGALYNGSFVLLVVLAGVFFSFGTRRRQFVMQRLIDVPLLPNLLPGTGGDRRKFKRLLTLLALFFGVLALMDPLYDYTWVTEKRNGVDILLALDVSKSMYAKDVSPSRFERSKLEILNLVEHLQGDRIGLIVFTSIARTQCPLTLDYEAFKLIASEIEIGVLSQGGTSFAAALDQAILSFDKQYKKERILILVTDGETQDSTWEKYVDKLKEANIRVYTVGLGSKAGAPIMLPSENGQKEYVKDENGNIVLSKLDEESLKKLALTTGGAYVQVETAGFNLEALYKEKIAPLQGRELEAKRQKRYEHRFYIPLALALFFLILETLLRELPTPGRKALPLSLLLFFLAALDTQAADALKEGEKAFHAGDYQKAELAYQEAGLTHPNSPELYFNQAAVLYKENKFENAAALFQKALSSTDPEIEAKAHYNLGNTFYRMGRLEQSVESYKKSLQLNVRQPDCQHNLEFVQQKIKELLDKQKDKPKEKEKPEKQKPQEQQKEQQKQETKNPEKEKPETGAEAEKIEKSGQGDASQNQEQQKDQKQGDDEKARQAQGSQENQKNQSQAVESKEKKEDKDKLSSEEMKELENQKKNETSKIGEEVKEDQTPGHLTKEEAERILKSLEDRERQKRKQQNAPPQTESSSGNAYYKDW